MVKNGGRKRPTLARSHIASTATPSCPNDNKCPRLDNSSVDVGKMVRLHLSVHHTLTPLHQLLYITKHSDLFSACRSSLPARKNYPFWHAIVRLSGQFISTLISCPRPASHCRQSLILCAWDKHWTGIKGSCNAVWSISAEITSLRRVQASCNGSERGMWLHLGYLARTTCSRHIAELYFIIESKWNNYETTPPLYSAENLP